MSGTQPEKKPLQDHPLELLQATLAMLAPHYPPAVVTEPDEIDTRKHLLLWQGGAHQVIEDLRAAIHDKTHSEE